VRKINLAGFGIEPITDSENLSDQTTSLPTLRLLAPAAPATPRPISEAWYDAGAGLRVASVYYDMISVSLAADEGNLRVADNDVGAGEIASSDLLTGTNSSAAGTFTPSTAKRFLFAVLVRAATISTAQKVMDLRRVAVFGNHGLTKRGTAPDEGFFGSDIIADVISKSPLNTVAGDSIEATSFVIPHVVYSDDTTLTQVIEQVTALGGSQNIPNDWGVYDNRTFFWRSPGTYGKTWHVRRDEVATSTSEGPDADRRVAGIKVSYEDGAGTTLSVGPPGSNSDLETTALLDSDTSNPAFRIAGAFASESVGITSQQGAINIGTMILNERNRLRWRGSVVLRGEVLDSNGSTYPVSEVRAGDQIVIGDDEDTSPRPVNSTTYEHSSQSVTATVGARPDSLEALLGQLSAVTERI